MQSIFLNNFRGFSDTMLPLTSVNFLVGENSTGKTSILALIELLARQIFWYSFDFNAGGYEFGAFNDIVSVHSPKQDRFQIGMYKYDDHNDDTSICFLSDFVASNEGLPRICRCNLLYKGYHCSLLFEMGTILGSAEKCKSFISVFSSPKKCFSYLQTTKISQHTPLQTPSETFQDVSFRTISFCLIELFRQQGILTAPFSFMYNLFGLTLNRFAGMAPIRATPKRTYDGYVKPFSPEGEHTPYVIRKELQKKSVRQNGKFKKTLDRFGEKSGLFETIEVTQFGKESSSPFELMIMLGKKPLRIKGVGYGVSQVLPVVVEILTHGRNSWLAFQQPEVHLHPKAQAALGDVLFQAAVSESQTLFVETHSDYLLDRFRIDMREKKHPEGFAQVLFFERTATGNRICPMPLDASGEYPIDQPPGFRSFFLQEQRKILGL